VTTLTRGRFVVIQVLVLALFCSLLSRLWYLQVVGGDSYRAQAQSNAVRDVIVQPQRGLIVDSTGRSLVANRLAWVVTVDRSRLAALPTAEQSATLRQLGRTLGLPYGQVLAQTKLCGEKGAPDAGLCWNGSPYEAVPVAADVDEDVALAIAERPEDFPAVEVQQQNVRSYPTPYGANAAHLLGYVTSVTEDEYAAAKQDDDTTLNAASQVGRSGLERSYDRFLRGLPGSTGKSVDSSGRVIGSAGATPARPGDTLVTSIDAKVQAKAEDELRAAIMTARQTHDDVTGEDYSDSPDYEAALAGRSAERPVVLLCHQPVNVDTAVEYGVDLQLSGHTHGGQLWPFHYIIAAQQGALSGLSRVEDTQLYVTAGAGFWGPPMRVGADPEIVVIELNGRGGPDD